MLLLCLLKSFLCFEDDEFRLFLETSETESSDDEDSDYSHEPDFIEEQQLEHLGLTTDEKDAEETNGDSSGQLLVKLLAMMLLTWQAAFNISDSAITALLQCLRQFMCLMGNILCINSISSFASIIPKTLHSLRKLTSINRDNFCQYVVCPKCMVTYTLSECYHTTRNGSATINTCRYVPFHKHPHKTSSLRKKCDSPLMTKIISFSGKEYLYPIRTYCYKKVVQSLETLIKDLDFWKV